MNSETKTYTLDELKELSPSALLDCLADAWGITSGAFEIWGELSLSYNEQWGILKNAYSIESGKLLSYPLKGMSEVASFWVPIADAHMFVKDKEQTFIRCQLELSPAVERNKHNIPFEMQVKPRSGLLLEKLPDNIPNDVVTANDLRSFIPKSIFNFHRKNAEQKLTKEHEKAKTELENSLNKLREKTESDLVDAKDELEKVNLIREQTALLVTQLEKSQTDLNTQNEAASANLTQKKMALTHLNKHIAQVEAEMNKKIERLKNYVTEKANFLETFEFIDKEDLDAFLLVSKPNTGKLDGVSFKDVLNGDYKKAVSYIQAHMVKKDVLYPRYIIENYITLLRSRDLIVLAGDSGSGKTNLVKSFAKAVGGKAVIIPVKPNWTSSEDLLGYYNPLEKKYLATPFLEALLDARQNPDVPYFICLDEMNLARVEYYFADFLSLLESRDETPEISLYANDESSHVLSELKAVVKIISDTQEQYSKEGVVDFVKLMQDNDINSQIRQSFGFSDKDSLIKYHSDIRRMLSAVMTMPSTIKLPTNVHIIGAINIDETTHYLSPKILDRAHVMRFQSPLLSNWDAILKEVEGYEFNDVSKPLLFDTEALGIRKEYPRFNRESDFCKLFIMLNKEFLHKLGVEFGMRTIRQGLNYMELFSDVNDSKEHGINNFLLHKVLPKFTFDGNKMVGSQSKLDLVDKVLSERIKESLPNYENLTDEFSSVKALEAVVENAKANDGVVNFWS